MFDERWWGRNDCDVGKECRRLTFDERVIAFDLIKH